MTSWPNQDWTRYDAQIAKDRGVSRQYVGRMRKQYAPLIQSAKSEIIEPDKYGYPTKATLRHIAQWSGDHKRLMDKIWPIWQYKQKAFQCRAGKTAWGKSVWIYEMSTCGWSGNESIIKALERNTLFWLRCWYQSRVGGHYIFHVERTTQKQKG